MYKIIDFLSNTIKGKTLYRILFQQCVLQHQRYIMGRVLDIGAGSNPSYTDYFPDNIDYIKTDYIKKSNVEHVLDFNLKFSFDNDYFNSVLLFHNLYIAKDQSYTLSEIHRVLKKGGCLLISSPFAVNEMPEPHDYNRLTKEGLDSILLCNDFEILESKRIGERFTLFAYSIHPLLIIWPIRLIVNAFALLLDCFIPNKLRSNYPFPIGYFYVVRKK